MGRYRILILALAWALAVPAFAGPPPIYQGVASCAGSTCHGRAQGNGAVVRQDELAHWQDLSSQGGAHSRSYAALASPRGTKIAAALGLGPATAAPACLGCHATAPPVAQRGAQFRLADGVGCESCHGASGPWIASHYAVRGTHADNVAHGLIALDRPSVRAGVCLDCHYGAATPGHFVTHQMMAAGHPRVSFELDLFSALEQHWNDTGSYAARKGKPDHLRLWAVGQAEAVRRSVTLYGVPALRTQGSFPEFTFFDCHSCHRQIDDDPARAKGFETNPARPIPFGTPPFNDENFILLSAAARVLVPAAAADFDNAARGFHAAIGSGRAADAAANRLATAADRLIAAIDRAPARPDAAFDVVAAIAANATTPRYTDYTGSVQAVMGLDTLLNALVGEGRITVGAAAGIRGSLGRAYAAVKAPNAFAPAAFRAALGDAAHAIGALR